MPDQTVAVLGAGPGTGGAVASDSLAKDTRWRSGRAAERHFGRSKGRSSRVTALPTYKPPRAGRRIACEAGCCSCGPDRSCLWRVAIVIVGWTEFWRRLRGRGRDFRRLEFRPESESPDENGGDGGDGSAADFRVDRRPHELPCGKTASCSSASCNRQNLSSVFCTQCATRTHQRLA